MGACFSRPDGGKRTALPNSSPHPPGVGGFQGRASIEIQAVDDQPQGRRE